MKKLKENLDSPKENVLRKRRENLQWKMTSKTEYERKGEEEVVGRG